MTIWQEICEGRWREDKEEREGGGTFIERLEWKYTTNLNERGVFTQANKLQPTPRGSVAFTAAERSLAAQPQLNWTTLKSFLMPLKAKLKKIQERCWGAFNQSQNPKAQKQKNHTHINQMFPFVYFKLSHVSAEGKKMHRCLRLCLRHCAITEIPSVCCAVNNTN